MTITGTKKMTGIILIVITIVLVIWDLFMVGTPTMGDTISEYLLNLAFNNPSIPFAFGCLMGHLFWPQIIKED